MVQGLRYVIQVVTHHKDAEEPALALFDSRV